MNQKSYTELLYFLRKEGYREATEIIQPGDFTVQGDTISVWLAAQLEPYRFHYLGDQLERVEVRTDQNWVKVEAFPEIFSNALSTAHGLIYPGEYIVHPYHGVGIFRGIIREEDFEHVEKVYISLEYAGNDRLLVPWDRLTELMPYIGTRHPRLTRLYSKAWQATKERVQRDLIKVARGLLKIYAERQRNTRPAYPKDIEWQQLLDTSAGFSLTDDQARSFQEIQADLTNSVQPMDRLLCGDVGFGKTEVALRAAAIVMAAGKQVAVIAPTTVLVEQHYNVMKERLANLPVSLAHMSRMTKVQDGVTLAGIRRGSVELVVGTHRLLSKDIEWKNLGLLIIDEEQKFGVSHKERLKELRPSLDVLSLSATPIPRTLSMSLSGLRGLSILRHAPHGRLPVTTVVEPFNENRITTALKEELSRGGQVYLVYNRVLPLQGIAERLRVLVKQAGYPDATIAVAHGQMGEIALAREMTNFMSGKTDILVASTIVEHGLDNPTANTLIVLRSERFGLSDLYQLRGRVGRRSIQAYAYFLTGSIHTQGDDDIVEETISLTQTAQKRLEALVEADSLGSGWSLALRDLEIRGGGNILGHEQHGSMESIGLLLYAQLLQEEIGRQAHQQGIQLFQKVPSETSL